MIQILGAVLAALLLTTLIAGCFARSGFPLPPAERRIGCIDGLRGYLALMVMAHHFIIWLQIARLGGTWSAPSLHVFNQFGAGGVGLFFMTTGLVFYPRILAGFRACNWGAVYVSRVFRLLPAIALSVVLVIVAIMLRTGQGVGLGDVRAALIWISTLGQPPLLGYPDSGRLNAHVLWSLHFEWIFYLAILPICALASDILRRRGLPSWLVPVGLLALSPAAFQLPISLPVLNFVPSFAVGMLGYECQSRPALARRLRGRTAALASALLLLLGMTAFATPYRTGLPFFGLFFACVACGNDFGGLLRTRGALVLGECSFSIYLLHGLALDSLYVDLAGLVDRFSAPQLPLLLPVVAVAVVVISAASFLVVERPFIRLGARITRRWKMRNALRMKASVGSAAVL